MKGYEVAFICATDEHGSPISVRAEQEGVSPKEIVDRYHEYAREDLVRVGCSFDVFARTTSPVHYELTREFFKQVADRGYVYEREYDLLYCARCKRFLPDRYVTGSCPHCKSFGARGDECPECGRFLKPTELEDPRCIFCRSKPRIRKTKHWFFRLSRFEGFLNEWIEKARLSKLARGLARAWLREGLRDWCISRDMTWGAPLPIEGAEGKVLYVWFDAPIGYISSTKIWAQSIGKPDLWKKYWMEEGAEIVHFIGKGIVYHHTLFWPAMLRANATLNLPTAIVAGGHYTLEGRKMSKSEGWVVEVVDYLRKFEPDLLRYYLISAAPLEKDADFSWADFARRCNSELADVLGNFIHRVLTFIHANFGCVPDPGRLDRDAKCFLELIRKTHEEYERAMEEFDFHRAIKLILKISAEGNRYLSKTEPWKLLKTEPWKARAILYVCMQAVKAIAIWMGAFMPHSAEKLWKLIGLEGSVHEQRLDEALREVPPGHSIGKPEPLFKKITEAEVREQEELLKAD